MLILSTAGHETEEAKGRDLVMYLHSNRLSKNQMKGIGSFRKVLVITLIFCLAFNMISPVRLAKAAANQVNIQLDYLNETITVMAGTGGSLKFYMSTDKMKTWELLEPTGTVDISAMLSTKEVLLYFKGNKDTDPVTVKLDAEDKSLQVFYKIVNGEGRIEFNNPAYPVEFRKGTNGAWKTAYNLMPTAIYEYKGATLYFRTPATIGKRAGKVVTVKISKKPTAPSVKLDMSKLSVTGLKSGETQYRVGDSSTWLPFSSLNIKNNSLDLRSILAPNSLVNTPVPAGTIEFRTAGTDKNKKLNSSVKVIEVPLQPAVPDQFISINGSTVTISDPNTRRYYEYTVVPQNKTLDLSTAKWTSITSKSPVIVKSVNINDKILVRLKSATDPTTKITSLASTYKELTVASISLGR